MLVKWLEVNANLGTVKESEILKRASFNESKSYVVNDLEVIHRIEADYNIKNNVLGVPACQRVRHNVITIKNTGYRTFYVV